MSVHSRNTELTTTEPLLWLGRWSLVSSRTDNEPKPREGTVNDLLSDIRSTFDLCQKDGPAIIGATFREGGLRRLADVEAVTMLVFDLDHGVAGDLDDRLKAGLPVQHLGHTTWSNRATNGSGARENRMRLYIPLSREISTDEHHALWLHAADKVREITGADPDRAARDATRLNYTLRGRNPKSDSEPRCWSIEGALLNPDSLPWGGRVDDLLEAEIHAEQQRKINAQRQAAESRNFSQDPGQLHRYLRRALDDECSAVAGAAKGKRNATLNRAAYKIGTLLHRGLSETEATEELFLAADRCGYVSDDGEAQARKTIRSGLQAGQQEPRDLSGIGRSDPRPAASTSRDKHQGSATAPQSLDSYQPTDLGNAERLVSKYGKRLRYCEALGEFYVYGGLRPGVWTRDDSRAVVRFAKNTIRALGREAFKIEDDDARQKAIKFALSSERSSRVAAMIDLAKAERDIAVRPNDLDSDPRLFCVENGLLDPVTGELQQHSPDKLNTMAAPVRYDPAAECPVWREHIRLVTDGDDELAEYMQRAFGYALVGIMRDQAVFFLHGRGENGKSTTTETLLDIIGDYGVSTEFETFSESSGKGGDARPELLDLRGRRFVLTSESNAGERLNESLIKRLTGGNTISARALYRSQYVKFRPTFKIFAEVNHPPVVRNVDHALWRRVKMIPFLVRIPKSNQRDRKAIDADLRAEASGILNWLVEGCQQWHENGLGECQAVTDATAEYREDSDPLAAFIEERCLFDSSAWSSTKELRQAHERWCDENREKPMSPQRFGALLRQRSEIQARRAGHGGGKGWSGIRLRRASPGDVGDVLPLPSNSSSTPPAKGTFPKQGGERHQTSPGEDDDNEELI